MTEHEFLGFLVILQEAWNYYAPKMRDLNVNPRNDMTNVSGDLQTQMVQYTIGNETYNMDLVGFHSIVKSMVEQAAQVTLDRLKHPVPEIPNGNGATIFPISLSPDACQSSEILIQNTTTFEKKCWPGSEAVPEGWVYLFGGDEVVEEIEKTNWWLWVILAVIGWRIYRAR